MPTTSDEAFVVVQKSYDKLQCIDQHSLSKFKISCKILVLNFFLTNSENKFLLTLLYYM